MQKILLAAALGSGLCFAVTAKASVISDLDGHTLPDGNYAQDLTAAIGTWDLHVPNNLGGDGTGETPYTSNNHGFDNFLGPSNSVTIGTVTYNPPAGTARGYDSVRPITGDPSLAQAATGTMGHTLVHYEPRSQLGTGNYGFFMNVNASGGLTGWSQFKLKLGSAPASSNQISVSTRFKIDYVNNGDGHGNGILSLLTPNNETIALSIRNFSTPATDDHYGLRVYRYNKDDPPVLLKEVENINGDPLHPLASVHSSPGYYTAKMYSDSSTHTALVYILDETSHYAHSYTLDITDPNVGANPALTGSVAFGAALADFNNPNAELKMVFDNVKVETDQAFVLPVLGDMNGDGRFDNFDISAFQLALTNLSAYQAQYASLLDFASRGDMNGDGRLDNFDIPGFELGLTTAHAAVVPEPSTLALLGLGLLASGRPMRAALRRRRGAVHGI